MLAKLQVSPINSYIDEEVNIKVMGCMENTEVSIYATTFDETQKKFTSYATFIVPSDRIVDVATQKPVKGTYDTVDASGLFWSMMHTESKWDDYYEKKNSNKVSITLVLKVNGIEQDSLTIQRFFYRDEDVTKETVAHQNIVGTVFHPKQKGTFPAVIVLSGSDGGMQEHAAALLASKGYTVLALPYFGSEEGVPNNLENIPLEYFQEATDWLREHPAVNGNISLIGYSRGGELALLLGATFDSYKSIIAGVPSAYITAGMKNGIFAPVPSWVFQQKPLPYLKFTYRFSSMVAILKNWIVRRPISYLSIWDNSLKNEAGFSENRIAVEDIHAPLLLITGDDDQLWPSSLYVKMIEDKLKHSKTTHQNRYLYYDNAGHFLSFPYSFVNLPAQVYMNVGGGMTMTFGGSKAANAKASRDSWLKILDFLAENA
ncbi:Acyl-CoA thioester hydrolase/BAAT N-terminal region [Oceanobacillus limi]|uniref:Acyl-CoA thioester hydrolase/BAAT N-terminal region n=1 Tax=Oceanobacillus limi TaxID=930131 RepID=A0A1H9Y6U8_9BACI|nr:alpha/beta fold hydrolase [Oceanobacillus limi]SES64515.1 Acyl-CoA thioester hydrolase/BAAT N-terminal region [Oceanobacillus limi]